MPLNEKIKVLVAGQMRSGTTFVANLLNTQKDFFVYSDMLVSLFDHISALDLKNLNAPLSDRQKNILFSNLNAEGLNRGLRFDVIRRDEVKTWMELYERSLNELTNVKDMPVIGVKCTKSDGAFKDLLKLGHKVIYCIRDPRDVLYSAQNRFAGVNQLAYLSKWKESINNVRALIGSPHLYILKYEDFILFPEEQCKKLSLFLGKEVRHDIQGELVHGIQNGYTNNSSFGDVHVLFDKKAAYRWKKGEVTHQTLFVSYLLRDEIRALGYEDLSEKVSASEKMKWSLLINSKQSIDSLQQRIKPVLKNLFYK